jgi:hypothetical protein
MAGVNPSGMSAASGSLAVKVRMPGSSASPKRHEAANATGSGRGPWLYFVQVTV